MPARVTLTVTEGDDAMRGKEYRYEEPTTCIIGRAEDCDPRLPDDDAHQTCSRYHCLVDINPPNARVRDFGSLNGTSVNGERIGQRERHETAEEGAQREFPEHDLQDGDEIELCDTVFRVSTYEPATCDTCSGEIPENENRECERLPGVFVCDVCYKKEQEAKKREEKATQEPPPPPRISLPRPRRTVCRKCGKEASKEAGRRHRGDYICASCRRSDIAGLLNVILAGARQGRPELRAIQGYTMLRRLGRGGMGEVFLAKHDKKVEQVALKLMLPQVAAKPEAVKKFLREIEVSKVMKHPNVVDLRDSGYSEADETFFFTLEFCDGGSVDGLMQRRGGKLSVDEACRITLQALDGLEYAHHVRHRTKIKSGEMKDVVGVVHRDIKPPNILLCGSGPSLTAKVTDFGLGKAFDTAGLSGYTHTGNAAGSPWYMPRQQVVNFKYSKPEVDVWAMAATLYQMLCGLERNQRVNGFGIVPRRYPPRQDAWQVTLKSSPVPIRDRNSEIPDRLAEVIDAALIDKDYERTGATVLPFKSAAAFKKALEGAL